MDDSAQPRLSRIATTTVTFLSRIIGLDWGGQLITIRTENKERQLAAMSDTCF